MVDLLEGIMPTREDLEEEVVALRSRIEALEPHKKAKDPPEATTCLLCCNSWRFLPMVTMSLWVQGVRMDLHTLTDTASIDPTEMTLSSERMKWYMEHHASKTIREYRYLGTVPHQANMEDVIAHAKGIFVARCASEFIFFLDHDVVMPPAGIAHLLEEMRGDKTIGALCIPYNHDPSHVEQGAMLMRRQVAWDVGFNGTGKCVCRNLAEALQARGLSMRHWGRAEEARHLKWTGV